MNRRVIAAITIGAGALLVVLGSLFPLYGIEVEPGSVGDTRSSGVQYHAVTPWEVRHDPPLPPDVVGGDGFPVYGYGLVPAAVLAGLGAVLQLRSPRLAMIGRFGALVGLGLVVGTVWAAVATLSTLFGGPPGYDVPGEFVGGGTWMLGGAAVVLLAGTVLAQDWPPRLPQPTGVSVYQVDDDDTPPFGIPIPVGEIDYPGETPAPEPPADDRRHPTGGNPSTVE